MYKNIDYYEFRNEFKGSQYENNFSNEGLQGLYDYLKNYEDETGEQIELDLVAIACDYTEFDSLDEINLEMGKDYSSIEDLENDTTVVYHSDNSIVINNF